MKIQVFSGWENGEDGVFGQNGGFTVQNTVVLSGSYSPEIDPVNGTPAPIEIYGGTAGVNDTPEWLVVPFLFRFTEDSGAFDTNVVVLELGGRSVGDPVARQLILMTDETLEIWDKDGDEVGGTTNPIVKDNTYAGYWFLDQRTANTKDALWLQDITGGDGNISDAALQNVIDVLGHGDRNDVITAITVGTRKSKGLPTQGGPFWVDNVALFDLSQGPHPNADLPGSITAKYKKPNAVGTDNDFVDGDDNGSGEGNPHYTNVDDIPSDDLVTYDQNGTSGDEQSYGAESADGGDVPLAIQVIGWSSRTAGSGSARVFIYDGSAYDYGPTYSVGGGGDLHGGFDHKTYNQVDGNAISEAAFANYQPGIENVTFGGGSVHRLSQIGLEYMIEGPYTLPSDFPKFFPPLIMSY